MRTREERITRLRERVAHLEAQAAAARARSEGTTAGGLSGYDPAILSGIRRRPSPRADARRFAAYQRESDLWRELDRARQDLASLVLAEERAKAEETAKAELTLEMIRTAKYVRDRYGWHQVIRVSAKSVTVATWYSWNDRIAISNVLDVKPGGAA